MRMAWIVTAAAAALLSFLSMGIFWTGVNPWIQSPVSVLFVCLAYVAAKKTRRPAQTAGAALAYRKERG